MNTITKLGFWYDWHSFQHEKHQFTLSLYGPYGKSQAFTFNFLVGGFMLGDPCPFNEYFFQEKVKHFMFSGFICEVTAGFVDDLPKHIKEKEKSYFVVIRKDEFLAMPTSTVHIHLWNCHIIIPDMNLRTLTFDRHGIHKLDCPDALVQIEGKWLSPDIEYFGPHCF